MENGAILISSEIILALYVKNLVLQIANNI